MLFVLISLIVINGCPQGIDTGGSIRSDNEGKERGREDSLERCDVTGPERMTPSVGVVADCDVAAGIPRIAAARDGAQALVLVRVFGEPIGMLSERLSAQGLEPHELAAAMVRELEPQLRERIEESGLTWTGELPTAGLRPPQIPRFLQGRALALCEGPTITVAVCTRDRPEALALILDSLSVQDYGRLQVLVVDNAPSDLRSQRLVAELAREREIDYVTEPHPGLSWARNRAIEASSGEIVAYVDDDALCDRWWAVEVARGFVEVPNAGAVTGIIIPEELETQSQSWYEQYSGVRRGRGFSRAVFSPATAHLQSPLYPLPPWGSGGNMAFRRDALERIGGFDCALGAGTPTLGGEDTAALSTLLLAGGTIVYQPSAIVRHRHRREYAAMRRVLLGYGRGLGAYYTAMLVRQPSCAPELLRLSRQAVRDQFSRHGRRSRELDEDFPRELLRANRIGLLQGPFMYAAARLQVGRMKRADM
jgi:glycosyltransferase involved in cell wall biosynthesis